VNNQTSSNNRSFLRGNGNPCTSELLADMGADVIKVENPSAPDFTRATGNSRCGTTAFYYNLNRGKRSLATSASNYSSIQRTGESPR